MVSSSFDQSSNTFKVILANGVEVTGTYKVVVVNSISFCGLSFQINCNRQEPPTNSTAEQGLNFMIAQKEISKKISEYAFNHVQFKMFPNAIEVAQTVEKV